MEKVLSVLLFVLACNLDTLILSFTYTLRGTALSPGPSLAVAGITSAITGLSLGIGMAAAGLLASAAGRLGALLLALIGLLTLLDWLRAPRGAETPPNTGSFSLAAALAVNNAAAGLAAGVSGLPPLRCAAVNFLVTLALLWAGRRLAETTSECRLSRYALPLSGVLLMLLGAMELWK